MHHRHRISWTIAAASLLTAGPILLLRGRDARAQIGAELADQTIAFPERGLPAGHEHLAGRQVETGAQARAYADLIKANLVAMADGRTYAQVSADLHAADGADEKLADLRNTMFMGESLRASLLSVYQAWQLTRLVDGLGALFTVLGAAALRALPWRDH